MFNDDTLFYDPNGHAADLFDGIQEGGIEAVYEILALPEEEWDMGFGWGCPLIMAIEVLAAASGKPSSSQEAGYIVSWAEGQDAEVTPDTKSRMLSVIDKVIAQLQSDPESCYIGEDAVEARVQDGQRMRERISSIEPSS